MSSYSNNNSDIISNINNSHNKKLVGAGIIWSFWDGNAPDLVLRCFESIRINNPERPFIVVSKDTLSTFLDSEDYPFFHGRRGTQDDFSKVQYLADWVRLTLLEKYGGIWLDASIICTSPVNKWIDDEEKLTTFPMHANPNIHGNWAMAAIRPGNPVVRAWRQEMATIFNEIGSGSVPVEYIQQSFDASPTLVERWNNPTPPPLPYLWVYLALQVVLERESHLHEMIHLRSCTDGPMYRRYHYNIVQGINDGGLVSQMTADDLATLPLDLDGSDRWFIKLVGTDRNPVQKHLDCQTYVPGSALAGLAQTRARFVEYGVNLCTTSNSLSRFRASVCAVIASQRLLQMTSKQNNPSTLPSVSMKRTSSIVSTRRRSSLLAFAIM